MTTYTNRAGGRKARHLLRSSKSTSFNPAPPGISGGTYKPLSERDCDKVMGAAPDLAGGCGHGRDSGKAGRSFLETGAERTTKGRLVFSALVEDTIAKAAQRFVFHGRDPDRSIEVGSDSVHFGTGGAAVQTLDLNSGDYSNRVPEFI